MKVFNLHCQHGHHFEGWFSAEQDFQDQLSGKRIACPVCDSSAVTRLPSSPRLRRATAASESANTRQSGKQEQSQLQQRLVLETMRRVLACTEDVGERFAEVARRIHYDETPDRPIRGVASRAECDALAEEGIDVLPLPSLLKQPLQ
jgi:hypothetical protein